MGMTAISKSQVSRLCGDIDERVGAFLKRPLEGDSPYLWIAATYVKVRQAGRIVSVAVIIAVEVTTDGVREVLRVAVGPSEAELFWIDSLRSLTRRGLRGVKLVISDSHSGLKATIEDLPGNAAALLRALHVQRAGSRRQGPTANGPRAHQHRVRARLLWHDIYASFNAVLECELLESAPRPNGRTLQRTPPRPSSRSHGASYPRSRGR